MLRPFRSAQPLIAAFLISNPDLVVRIGARRLPPSPTATTLRCLGEGWRPPISTSDTPTACSKRPHRSRSSARSARPPPRSTPPPSCWSGRQMRAASSAGRPCACRRYVGGRVSHSIHARVSAHASSAGAGRQPPAPAPTCPARCLQAAARPAGRPRLLACHDMRGGYLEDRFVQARPCLSWWRPGPCAAGTCADQPAPCHLPLVCRHAAGRALPAARLRRLRRPAAIPPLPLALPGRLLLLQPSPRHHPSAGVRRSLVYCTCVLRRRALPPLSHAASRSLAALLHAAGSMPPTRTACRCWGP